MGPLVKLASHRSVKAQFLVQVRGGPQKEMYVQKVTLEDSRMDN